MISDYNNIAGNPHNLNPSSDMNTFASVLQRLDDSVYFSTYMWLTTNDLICIIFMFLTKVM